MGESACAEIQRLYLFAHDDALCARTCVETNVEREGTVGAGDGADDGEVGVIVEEIVADDDRRVIACLLVSRLRREVDADDVTLFYHASSPAGVPQSIISDS